MTDIATREPDELYAGDRVQWTINDNDRPPSSWTMTYSLQCAGKDRIELTATDNGDGTHLMAVAASATADWEPGEYKWQRHFTNGAVRETTAEGWLVVKPDFATSNIDPRSAVKRTLDALEAVRENKASGDQLSMSIQGRSISRMSWEEINQAYEHFKALWDEECRVSKSDRGLQDNSRRVKVRFDDA